ncbi:MAG: response regulator, partial [Planctomycetota bacterium]
VLLSDISMPDEDGYELIRRIRDLPLCEGGGVPAAALTGLVRPEDRERAQQAGYQMHLSKPLETSELIKVVAQLAGRMATS